MVAQHHQGSPFSKNIRDLQTSTDIRKAVYLLPDTCINSVATNQPSTKHDFCQEVKGYILLSTAKIAWFLPGDLLY
jgi:hypothetical protein